MLCGCLLDIKVQHKKQYKNEKEMLKFTILFVGMIKKTIFVPNKIINLNLIIMSNKKETLQDRKKELVKELTGKIEGFTTEMLESLEVQELQTIADNLAIVNKSTGNKTRTNVATEVLKHFLDNEITELKASQVYDLVRINNVLNYFNLVDGNELPKTREAINAFILLKRLVSNNNKTNAERQTAWLKRGKAYTNSHIIGTENDGSLFKNENATHYFKQENDVIKLVEKAKK